MASEPRSVQTVQHVSQNFAVPKPKVTVYTDENALRDNPMYRRQLRHKLVGPWNTPDVLRRSPRVPLTNIGEKDSGSDGDYYIEPS